MGLCLVWGQLQPCWAEGPHHGCLWQPMTISLDSMLTNTAGEAGTSGSISRSQQARQHIASGASLPGLNTYSLIYELHDLGDAI